jgi:glycosyltransferase involved in cell wall biosynthesis
VHSQIFGGLIPENRLGAFINQDLDPYLQRLYLQYGAAPLVVESQLTNRQGGNDVSPARYKRVPAACWRDWVLEDASPIYQYLQKNSTLLKIPQCFVVDVVVPTYRLDLFFLEKICSLEVPENFRTTFIVVVDNPSELARLSAKLCSPGRTSDPHRSALLLEQHLVVSSKAPHNGKRGNNVRVRCNAQNLGASASRNLGLDESSAEYVLFLDDDVVPDPNLLASYGLSLDHCTSGGDCDIVGVVGLVRFPRNPDLPLSHAAVLMSYLTFMFEIADNPQYARPAWGVTANILVKRGRVRFDTAYAKTGGGEDVDFCLRLTQETSGQFITCPSAIVHHPFWPGSPFALSGHFFNWATGDSALFTRFPEHCYRSWPNAVESLTFLVPFQVATGSGPALLLMTFLLFLLTDVAVDMCDGPKYQNRCSLLKHERKRWFYPMAHLLANTYVLILETGRLWGHLKRFEIQNLTRRFDWHCGRLESSRRNFQRCERNKFVCFCSVAVAVFAFRYA